MLKSCWAKISPYIFAIAIGYLFIAMAISIAYSARPIHADSYLALAAGRDIANMGIAHQDNLSADTI